MKISARNVLQGTVKTVKHGEVNSEVTVKLAGGAELVSMITKASAKHLGIKKGKKVVAIIKASNIILGTE
ncbi:MAG: TOBE domain-containing protein [Gammaproteobacteria bacterium]